MFVALIEAELHLPTAGSLKAKRKVLHSIRDRLHARHRVSITETEHHDLWQRATLGIASVHTEFRGAERAAARLREAFDDFPGVSLTRWEVDVWSNH